MKIKLPYDRKKPKIKQFWFCRTSIRFFRSKVGYTLPLIQQNLKMKRVAIPIVNEQLSENFGECNHYEIYEIDKKITDKKTAFLPVGLALADLPGWLKKEGVTDVITYRVNREIINLFASKKVNLFIGIPIKSPEKLIDDYLKGKLESDKYIIAELTKV